MYKWAIFSLVTLIFLLTPFKRGLFFNEDLYLINSLLFVAFLTLLISFYKKTDLLRQYMNSYLLVLIIPFFYLCSFFISESPYSALQATFRWVSFSVFFLLILFIRQEKRLETFLPYVFYVLGIMIAGFSFAGLWGVIDYKDVVLDNRLSGVFQYPNTLAAVLCSFWLFALVMLSSNKLTIKKVIFYSLPLTAFSTILFASYSRGTLLMFPLAWFIGLILLRLDQQITYTLYLIYSLIGGIIVFSQLHTPLEINNFSYVEVVTLLLISLIVTGLIAITHVIFTKYGNKIKMVSRKRYKLILPVGIIASFLLLVLDMVKQGLIYRLLPISFQQRLTATNFDEYSVLGRFTFTKDAFEMLKDSPILGYGGNGWKVIFTQYQQLAYWSTEVHNGYLGILLDIGFVGAISLILVLVLFIIQIAKNVRNNENEDKSLLSLATIPPLALFFIHSIIDFDFSYGTVWLIIFWLFGMGVQLTPYSFSMLRNVSIINKQVFQRSIYFVLLLCISLSTIYNFRFLMSQYTLDTITQEKAIAEARSKLETATKYNPYLTDSLINLASVYMLSYKQTKSKEEYEKLKLTTDRVIRLEPHNAQNYYKIASILLQVGEGKTTDELLTKALSFDRFNVDLYDALIKTKIARIQQSIQNKEVEREKAKKLAEESLQIYTNYEKVFEPVKQFWFSNRRPTELYDDTYISVAQALLVKGEYEKSIKFLERVSANSKFYSDSLAVQAAAYEAVGNIDTMKGIVNGKQSQQNFINSLQFNRMLVRELK
ncbi:O-antigen ligase family protein [Brevibacillus sp. SYSU BS000544]|uniref:O-antigen ligase family protein n=1 Tax=Brevibacillus sp. SYSU BS000544 TaxID=3416443 RepID=UPI003CE57366